jgi:hypothetical protein
LRAPSYHRRAVLPRGTAEGAERDEGAESAVGGQQRAPIDDGFFTTESTEDTEPEGARKGRVRILARYAGCFSDEEASEEEVSGTLPAAPRTGCGTCPAPDGRDTPCS